MSNLMISELGYSSVKLNKHSFVYNDVFHNLIFEMLIMEYFLYQMVTINLNNLYYLAADSSNKLMQSAAH